MLPSCNDTKERLSLAYVRAVAARCRSWVGAEEGGDFASVDATIQSVVQPRRIIFAQLKSSSAGFSRASDSVCFDLDVRAYDHLRAKDVIAPHLLILVELPEATEDWVTTSDEGLLLRRAAWWTDLWGSPETSNLTKIRVQIPESRRFDPASLTKIYDAQTQILRGAPRKPLHEF